jgi:hypothetical protein
MDVVEFEHFARTKSGHTARIFGVADVCMDAMEEGSLSVIAKQRGYCLWENFTLTPDQCALVQRERLRASMLWRWGTCVRWTRRCAFTVPYLVSEDPDAMAALSRIEFLWQDLDAVQAYLNLRTRAYDVVDSDASQAWMRSPGMHNDMEWVAAEVARRRQWFTGLRRAWLLKAVE